MLIVHEIIFLDWGRAGMRGHLRTRAVFREGGAAGMRGHVGTRAVGIIEQAVPPLFRARNLGKRRGECPGECPGELSMDARLSMMQDSIDKAASKAQAKAQKTQDGHDAPTSPGSPSSRRQEVANIRAMLDADPAILLCKEGKAERARRNKEKMLQKASHIHRHSRSFHGDVGNELGLDPDGRRAPSLFGSSEPPKFRRSTQSLDEECVMHRKPHKARSLDTKGGSAKQFPCSSFEIVQAARLRLEQNSASRDSLNCDRARPISPTTEFLLSTSFDDLMSLGSNSARASRGYSLKGSDGLQSPKDAADPFSPEGSLLEKRSSVGERGVSCVAAMP
jgi:hypothetical protein